MEQEAIRESESQWINKQNKLRAKIHNKLQDQRTVVDRVIGTEIQFAKQYTPRMTEKTIKSDKERDSIKN